MNRIKTCTFRALLLLCVVLSLSAAAFDTHAQTLGYTYNENNIYQVDLDTGAVTPIYTFGTALSGGAAIAQRSSDGMIFYIDGLAGNDTVYRWNPNTPTVAPVQLGRTGTPATSGYLPRLSFASNGTLYAVNTGSTIIYTINQTTGVATNVGTLTGGTSGGGDIAFAPSGTLYMMVGTTLYTVPLTGGALNNVGNITGITGTVTGVAFNSNGSLRASNSANPAVLYTIPLTGGAATAATTSTVSMGDMASALAPDLTLTKTHSGNFTQGQTGATYTLTVRNAGNMPTDGTTVTLTDTLPAGLTPTGASGTGWTCTTSGQTVTCTRTTALAAQASSVITLTVNVAANAAANVTNTASVSGGGDFRTTNNSASDATTINPSRAAISGIVFEDVNYGGGAGRSLSSSGGAGRGGVRVELYNAGGAFVSFTTTATTGTVGAYSFTNLAAGNYTVRVVNNSVTSSRTGSVATLLPVQTFRVNASSSTATADTARVGGEDPRTADAGNGASGTIINTTTGAFTAGITGQAQSITPVTLSAADIAGVDFGFNFSIIVNTNDAGQGSLRQFIINSNTLTNGALAQSGLTSGVETSVFMISNGTARPGLRSGLTNQLNASGVAVITPLTALPAITNSDTAIDGTTQTANVGNTNSGALGAGGTVGVDNLSLSTVARPEVQIVDGATIAVGLDVQVSRTTIRGLSIYGFGNAANSDANANIRIGNTFTDTLIEANIIGANAISFTDPGAGARSVGDNIRSVGADNGTVRNNLIGFSAGKGFGVEAGSTLWTIENNEIRGNAIGNSNLDGIDFETAGSTGNTARGNLVIANEGVGFDSFQSNGSNTVINNTITANGRGAGANVETAGVRVYGANNTIERNIINGNYGAGVMVNSGASANLITRNSIFANGTITNNGSLTASNQIGIDLQTAADNLATGTAPFVTLNDNGDVDAGGNGLLNFPVLERATINGGQLTLTGFARPGANLEFFIAAPDASGFGEGQTYLITLAEGSVADTDTTNATYVSPFAGRNVGTDTTERFSFTIALPSGVTTGSTLTATATVAGSTSEFSNLITIANAPPIVELIKSVSPEGDITPGTDLTYTIAFTNIGGSPATGFRLTDPDPATALRLNTNTDFKLASAAAELGTTGLTVTFEYSNDNAATWTYTPVSAAGGAPAGYDRTVTHVRWVFTGSLSHTAPNNTGSVSFIVRVR